MGRRQDRTCRTDKRFPYTTLFRSPAWRKAIAASFPVRTSSATRSKSASTESNHVFPRIFLLPPAVERTGPGQRRPAPPAPVADGRLRRRARGRRVLRQCAGAQAARHAGRLPAQRRVAPAVPRALNVRGRPVGADSAASFLLGGRTTQKLAAESAPTQDR